MSSWLRLLSLQFFEPFYMRNIVMVLKIVVCWSDNVIIEDKSLSVEPFLQIWNRKYSRGVNSGEYGGSKSNHQPNEFNVIKAITHVCTVPWFMRSLFFKSLNRFNKLVPHSPLIFLPFWRYSTWIIAHASQKTVDMT